MAYGFEPNPADSCIYRLVRKGSGHTWTTCWLQVDRRWMDKFKKDISLRFRMKDLGAGDGDRKNSLGRSATSL